jgi:hypothetical protein
VAQSSQRLSACRSRRAGADRLAVSTAVPDAVLDRLFPTRFYRLLPWRRTSCIHAVVGNCSMRCEAHGCASVAGAGCAGATSRRLFQTPFYRLLPWRRTSSSMQSSATAPCVALPPASMQSSATAPCVALPPASMQSSATAPCVALPPASMQSFQVGATKGCAQTGVA